MINKSPSSNKRAKKSRVVPPKRKPKDQWIMQYTDFFAQEEKIISEKWIEQFCKDYLKWALNNDKETAPLITKDFRVSLGIDKETMDRWLEYFPFLKKTHSLVVEIIGSRRERGGLRRALDPGMVSFSQPNYDSEWKELVEWRSALKKKEENGSGNVTVVMEKFDSEPVRKPIDAQEDSTQPKNKLTPEEVATIARSKTSSAAGGK